MSNLFIPQASMGLPVDLYQRALYEAHTDLPSKLPLGSIIVDRARDCSFILAKANDKINDKRLVQQVVNTADDTTDLTGDAIKGSRGSREVELTIAGVTKNQYKGGTLRSLDDVQYIYKIQSNTATDGGKIKVVLTSRLVQSVEGNEDVRLRTAFLVAESSAASADPAPALGMSLTTADEDEYLFIQQTGEADIVSGTISAGDITAAKSLTKGAGGTVVAAGEAQQVVGYHTRVRTGNVTNGTIIPVKLVCGATF